MVVDVVVVVDVVTVVPDEKNNVIEWLFDI